MSRVACLSLVCLLSHPIQTHQMYKSKVNQWLQIWHDDPSWNIIVLFNSECDYP